MMIEGFGTKKIENILSEIEKARTLPIDRFLIALAIPLVGRRSAQMLSLFFREQDIRTNADFHMFLSRIESPEMQEQLLSIRDLGPQTLREFVHFFVEHRSTVDRLLDEVVLSFGDASSVQGEESGVTQKTFCVTGSFDGLSRDDIHQWIESRGGLVRTSVTRDLDYLIIGEKAGSKADKAEKLGVQMINLQELYALGEK